jgi:hypothetical protein
LKKISAFENGRNEQNTKNEKVVKSAKNAKRGRGDLGLNFVFPFFLCFSSGLVAVGSGLKDTGRSGDVSLGTPDVRPRIETSTQSIDP